MRLSTKLCLCISSLQDHIGILWHLRVKFLHHLEQIGWKYLFTITFCGWTKARWHLSCKIICTHNPHHLSHQEEVCSLWEPKQSWFLSSKPIYLLRAWPHALHMDTSKLILPISRWNSYDWIKQVPNFSHYH